LDGRGQEPQWNQELTRGTPTKLDGPPPLIRRQFRAPTAPELSLGDVI
jgi:hypothetical protein